MIIVPDTMERIKPENAGKACGIVLAQQQISTVMTILVLPVRCLHSQLLPCDRHDLFILLFYFYPFRVSKVPEEIIPSAGAFFFFSWERHILCCDSQNICVSKIFLGSTAAPYKDPSDYWCSPTLFGNLLSKRISKGKVC